MKKILLLNALFVLCANDSREQSCNIWGPYPTLGQSVTFGIPCCGSSLLGATPFCGLCLGEERILQFTPPCTANYSTTVTHYTIGCVCPLIFYSLRMRVATGVCNLNGYTCVGGSLEATTTYSLGQLTGGTTYDLLFDLNEITLTHTNAFTVTINCPAPGQPTVDDIQPTSAVVTWVCNCSGNSYVEYGISGGPFNPGIGSTPGTNGTLLSNVTSPATITGLTPGTKYDIYVRNACGTQACSNSTPATILTPAICSSSPVLGCGVYASYQTNGLQVGSWQNYGCVNIASNGQEKIWQFTAATAGTYSLEVYSNVNGTSATSFFYKDAAGSCNNLGWTCIGTVSSVPQTLTLGPLTAGTTYWLLADGEYSGTIAKGKKFRFDCPGVCSPPLLSLANFVTSSSAVINGICPSCTGTLYLEYGSSGFTPGAGSGAGGGTVIVGVTLPYTLTGLLLSTTYDVYVRQDCGATGFSVNAGPLTFTTCSTPPPAPGPISGLSSVCSNQSGVVYSVIPVVGATSYTWYLPNGASGSSTSNSITVNFSGFTGGTIYVKAINNCGQSALTGLTVAVLSSPTTPGPISGLTSVCSNQNFVNYSVVNDPEAISYSWSLPAGAVGSSSTNSISVNFSSFSGGNICVNASNACGASAQSCLSVSANNIPGAPSSISGLTSVCANQTGVGYSITNVAGATFYLWTLPSGASGASATNSITVDFTLFSSGNICVQAGNDCGISSSSCLFVTGISVPPAPSSISGATSVCSNAAGVVYSVTSDPNATSYVWTLPSGASGSSTTNSITVNYTSFAGGNICVKAVNSCGMSSQTCLAISIVAIPAMPSSISGTATPCANSIGVVYSCPAVSGATSYTWTVPSTATLTGGQGTTSITVNFSSTFTSGTIKVSSVNCAGSSAQQSLTVYGKPATPGTITGPTTFCSNQQGVPYSIAAVGGATSYTWTVPPQASVATGQGTTGITVNFGNKSGSVKVKANNVCGSSALKSLTVTKTCREGELMDEATMEWKLYPNPAQNSVTVEFYSAKSTSYQIQFINSIGEIVLNQDGLAFDEMTQVDFETASLPSGIYLVRVILSSGENRILRLMIE